MCEAAGLDHDKVVEQCRMSLYWFCYYLVSDWVSPNLHKPLGEWFQRGAKKRPASFLIMLPRGSYKTTMFSIALPLWMLVNDPKLRILLVMSSTRLAREKIGKMQAILTSRDFRHFFPQLVPDTNAVRWNKSEFEVARTEALEEPSVTGLGAESKMTGGHFDVQIFDDLIDSTAENSDVQMENAKRFLAQSAGLWVRKVEALQVVIGTFWAGGESGFYEGLLRNPTYQKVVLGSRVDDRARAFLASQELELKKQDGAVLFDHESEESLASSLAAFGPSLYANQMENMAAPAGAEMFRREDFQWFNWDGPEQQSCGIDDVWYPTKTLFRQLSVDPAGGRYYQADKSAIVVSGFARGTAVAFLLDTWQDNVPPDKLVEMILDMAERWDVQVIRPEYTGLSSFLEVPLREAMTRRGRYYPIEPAHPGPVAKGTRIIRGLQPWVANRQLYFRRDQQDLPSELESLVIDARGQVKSGASPNLVDALVYHSEFWRMVPNLSKADDEIPFEDDPAPERRVRARYGLERARGVAWL